MNILKVDGYELDFNPEAEVLAYQDSEYMVELSKIPKGTVFLAHNNLGDEHLSLRTSTGILDLKTMRHKELPSVVCIIHYRKAGELVGKVDE